MADTNIVAQAVRAMRAGGHDVVYAGERPVDPGDEALLAEAEADGRIFVTKDHDIGFLVRRLRAAHRGVLLLDDFGDPTEETRLIVYALSVAADSLAAGAFVRIDAKGVRGASS